MPRTQLIFFLSVFLFTCTSLAAELRGSINAEQRFFLESELDIVQHNSYSSFFINPELFFSWNDDRQSLTVTPFYRWDQHDNQRTHADLREFYWLYVGDWYELSAGLRKVFWGTTESQHLVDVINQTDLVENPDGEDKLGQPMVGTLVLTDLGSFEFYLLPYFRKRTFPDREGRLRIIPYIDTKTAFYESDNEEKHIDFAMRWAKILDNWDIGLSYFYGTNRKPSLVPGDITSENTFFIPFYNLMHQAGLDIQGVTGAWLWKLEAIRRFTDELDFTALTAGFEYTFYNVKESGIDIGLVSEYLYDNRGIMASSGFDDDLMIGMRLTPNDIQGTEILLSMIMDRSSRGRILRLEASRRLTDHLRLNLESTFFSNLSQNDSIYSLRKDDFIQFQLSYYF